MSTDVGTRALLTVIYSENAFLQIPRKLTRSISDCFSQTLTNEKRFVHFSNSRLKIEATPIICINEIAEKKKIIIFDRYYIRSVEVTFTYVDVKFHPQSHLSFLSEIELRQ